MLVDALSAGRTVSMRHFGVIFDTADVEDHVNAVVPEAQG